MLNLKELENELDELLSKETSESLKKWLSEKRKKSLVNYLGAGFIQECRPVIEYIAKPKEERKTATTSTVAVSRNDKYSLAA